MRRLTVLAAIALLIVACDSGGGSQLDTVAPGSSAPDPLPTLPATSAPTTVEVTAPAITLPEGVVGLSADGPWKLVDSAPGVTTPGLVYELMPGLWAYLPVVEDVANGITWTLNEEDRPIIESYLQARLVYYLAVTSDPMDFTSGGWAEFYVDGGDRLKGVMEPRGASGQVVYMEAGVVLRPTVIGDGRTENAAIVFDCVLDGAVRREADGSIAEGSTPGVVEDPLGSTLALMDEGWKLDRITVAGGACA